MSKLHGRQLLPGTVQPDRLKASNTPLDEKVPLYQAADPERFAWALASDPNLLDGAIRETIDIDVVENAGAVELHLQADGGGDLTCQFDSELYQLDCTPPAEVVLTAGSDAGPVLNYVFITEAAGVLTLAASTAGFPSTPHCPIAEVLSQSAASVAIDGATNVHDWTDHTHLSGENGHLTHVNTKIRSLPATHVSGTAGGDMVVSSPDAYLSSAAGVIEQLHEHTMPARDMQTGDPVFLVNDPTTAFKRILTLDDVTQDASGGAINNKWMNLILWGAVSAVQADCKLFINLSTGVYNTEASAKADTNSTAVYSIPQAFNGVGFLIARYTVQAKTSGAWVQSQKEDLRGSLPSTSPGGGIGLLNVVEDTTPQLGGALDVNGQAIVSVSDGDIPITPDGTGDVLLDGVAWPQADGSMGQVLATNGAGQSSWETLPAGAAVPMGFSGAGAVVNKSTTAFLGIGTGNTDTTEANQEFKVRRSGTISNLDVYVSFSSTTADSTVTLRKNGSDQTLTVTFGSGVTGWLADTSNSFTVAAGDTIAIEVTNNSGGVGSEFLTVESVSFEIA